MAHADLLAVTREGLAAAEARLERARGAMETARLLLETGRHDEAWERVPELLAGGLEAQIQASAILFAVHDYERLAPAVEALAAAGGDDPGVRRLGYRWWFAIDDLERLERRVEERSAAEETDLVDRLAAGRLAVLLHDLATARAAYAAALEAAGTAEERSWALHGLGIVDYHRRDFDAAVTRLSAARDLAPLDADLATSLGETLVRLGRTDEAIDLFELAVRLAPYHERAHYLLGNGYARKSYSQLFAAHPGAFAGDAGAAALVRRGSLAFVARRYGAARRFFAAALRRCPEYGRAHNGLARTVEAERTRWDVHRQLYEERFAAAPAPEIEGLEDYVVNWESLEPRHRKVVALAVAPWRRFLPVLLEAGATHYVKPLHERLSESPEQHLLRDERIHYDSRLWDDVRGVGGHHTVTGVEDVERMLTNGYNTVLHELTHQVQQLLPSELERRIQELYRRAKERDAETGEAFLSRYAAGSVWEYFAEGANALASPRRDRFDTREMVRERLAAKDPELLELIRELMEEADVTGAYTLALLSRGYEHLRHGRTAEALAAFREGVSRTPASEDALAGLTYGLAVAGRADEALALSAAKAREQPESAALALGCANALWLAGRGLGAARAFLGEARGRVRTDERFQVDLQLGAWAWAAGDAAAAGDAYRSVLAYQADHPQGLWGLASAAALGGRWEAAWRRYEEAVRLRSGVVALRADYARDLLRAGEADQARAQLDAALLLDPDDPEVLALQALWLLVGERTAEASEVAARALEIAPWCDTARLARARALIRAGHVEEGRAVLAPLAKRVRDEAPPEYVFRPEKGSYVLVHSLPAVLRDELARLLPD